MLPESAVVTSAVRFEDTRLRYWWLFFNWHASKDALAAFTLGAFEYAWSRDPNFRVRAPEGVNAAILMHELGGNLEGLKVSPDKILLILPEPSKKLVIGSRRQRPNLTTDIYFPELYNHVLQAVEPHTSDRWKPAIDSLINLNQQLAGEIIGIEFEPHHSVRINGINYQIKYIQGMGIRSQDFPVLGENHLPRF